MRPEWLLFCWSFLPPPSLNVYYYFIAVFAFFLDAWHHGKSSPSKITSHMLLNTRKQTWNNYLSISHLIERKCLQSCSPESLPRTLGSPTDCIPDSLALVWALRCHICRVLSPCRLSEYCAGAAQLDPHSFMHTHTWKAGENTQMWACRHSTEQLLNHVSPPSPPCLFASDGRPCKGAKTDALYARSALSHICLPPQQPACLVWWLAASYLLSTPYPTRVITL